MSFPRHGESPGYFINFLMVRTTTNSNSFNAISQNVVIVLISYNFIKYNFIYIASIPARAAPSTEDRCM